MTHRVEITPRAQADLRAIRAFVIRAAPLRGSLWFERLERAILSLANMPERCIVVPSLSTPTRAIRQLIFGPKRHAYRIYFTVLDGVVSILHVRHGARRKPGRV